MNLSFFEPLSPELTSLEFQARWLLSHPVVTDDPESAYEALRRLLASPPALGESRGMIGALRYELRWEGGFRRDRVAPESFPIEIEEKPFGRVDVLWAGKKFGLVRLNIAPGAKIPLHVHRVMQEHELTLSDGLKLRTPGVSTDDKLLPSLTSHSWQHDFPHEYRNESSNWQTLLCLNAPAFIPWDEIEVTS